jgi:transcriptional regulator with XRE-family HTH domain
MIVRKYRLEKGLSQEQLAEMAGISTRTLQRIERGAKASPETLKCLAAVLETDFNNLRKELTMPATTYEEPNGLTTPEPASLTNPFSEATLSDKEREAMEYVRDIRSFYNHAIKYGIVIVGLLIINLITNPSYLWVIWPALGWGIGLAFHGLSTFEIFDLMGDKWERRQIEKRLRRSSER